jgi:Zn-dependent protease
LRRIGRVVTDFSALGHIFAARAFGVSTPDVTLLPIGGVARLERIPEAPREEFLIAIAGPLVNVAIAFALVLLAGARLNAGDLNAVDSMHVSLIDRLAVVNIFLALFNMIPAFPMDGGPRPPKRIQWHCGRCRVASR